MWQSAKKSHTHQDSHNFGHYDDQFPIMHKTQIQRINTTSNINNNDDQVWLLRPSREAPNCKLPRGSSQRFSIIYDIFSFFPRLVLDVWQYSSVVPWYHQVLIDLFIRTTSILSPPRFLCGGGACTNTRVQEEITTTAKIIQHIIERIMWLCSLADKISAITSATLL